MEVNIIRRRWMFRNKHQVHCAHSECYIFQVVGVLGVWLIVPVSVRPSVPCQPCRKKYLITPFASPVGC